MYGRALFLLATLAFSAVTLRGQNEIEVFGAPQPYRPALTAAEERELLTLTTFGTRYFSAGDLSAAREQFEKANALARNHPTVLYDLAVIDLKDGKYDSAQDRIDLYRALYPQGKELRMIEKLEIDLDWVRDVEKRKKEKRGYVEFFDRGSELFAQGRYAEAADAFRTARVRHPDDASTVINEALALEASGSYAAAADRFTDYLPSARSEEKPSLQQRILRLRAETDDAKQSMLCPFCGHELPAGATWCHYCWHGPFPVQSGQWNGRSCAGGNEVSRTSFDSSGKATSRETLSCLFETATLDQSLRFSRDRQETIRQARRNEGWTYDGELLKSFAGSEGSELVLVRTDQTLTRIENSKTGEILEFSGHRTPDGPWMLDSRERVIDGQRYLVRYSYDSSGRISRQDVTHRAANRCAHRIESLAIYHYEGDRLTTAQLAGAYVGYRWEGLPKMQWQALLATGYGDSGELQTEDLTLVSHQKIYAEPPPPAMKLEIQTLYPSFSVGTPIDLAGRADRCAIDRGGPAGDPIDLRPFADVLPSLGMTLGEGVVHVKVDY